MDKFNKYSKKRLIELLTIYDTEIDVLDILINEVNGVELKDVDEWLNQLYAKVNAFHDKNNGLTDQDIENGYEQLGLFE